MYVMQATRSASSRTLQLGEEFRWASCCKAKKPRSCCLTKPGKDPFCGGRFLANSIVKNPSLRSHRTSEYAQSKTLSRTAVQSSMVFCSKQTQRIKMSMIGSAFVRMRKPIRTCHSRISNCACYNFLLPTSALFRD